MKKTLILSVCICLLLGCLGCLPSYAAGEQTTMPQSASYMFSDSANRKAAGIFTMSLPEGHNATSYSLYWGDATGNKLEGFTAVHTAPITSTTVTAALPLKSSVPENATYLLVYTKSEQYGECAVPYKIGLNAATVQTGNRLGQFVVVSDLHLGVGKGAEKNFVYMLKDVKATAPDASAIMVVGDAVHSADLANYELFDRLCEQIPDLPPIYRTPGEREYLSPDGYTYDPTAHQANLQLFLDHIPHPMGLQLRTPYYTFFLNGCPAIVFGADSYENGNAVYSQAQLTWLESTLKSINRTRPVFLFMHEPLPNTVAGSADSQGFGNVKNHAEIKKIIDQYPNILLFNGHSHWNMQDTNNIYHFSGGSRAFNTAAIVSLWEIGAGAPGGHELAGSQGYYVTVYEDAVLVQGRNFATGEWLSEAYYLLVVEDAPEQTKAETTQKPTTAKPSTTEQETEPGEDESGLRELIAPAAIVAALVLIAFIIVFRKSTDTKSHD